MLIAVLGNISSGKSTTCRLLSQRLNGYEYMSLDSYRRLNTKYWVSRSTAKSTLMKAEIERSQMFFETNAQDEYYKAVAATSNVIVEETGTGKGFGRSFNGRNKSDILIVRLVCSVSECVVRTQHKIDTGYTWPPLPEVYKDYSGMTDAPFLDVLKNSIIWMDRQLPNVKADLIYDSDIYDTEYIVNSILEHLV